jgi:hypothetical protein
MATRVVKCNSERLKRICETFSVWSMKLMFWLSSFLGIIACTSVSKNHKLALDKIQKEKLHVELDVKTLLPGDALKAFRKEKVALLNVHDFPDSALLSAKTKMNPPDLAMDEAKMMQMDRAEILRQALETFCDECDSFEVLLPIEKLSENQFNFFFDKIFLRQEVNIKEIEELTVELVRFDKLVLVLSSEDYEKNRGLNKDSNVVAVTEAIVKSEVYIFDLKTKSLAGRFNISLAKKDLLFYQKKDSTDKDVAKGMKEVNDVNIKTMLNDVRYDDIYPYPIVSESLTFFHYFYNELCKSLFMDTE